MYRWHKDKELDRLEIPASQVLHLKRSLSTVQIALPGFPAQEATAYVCAFADGEGVQVTVALHLHASGHLALYFPAGKNSPRQEAGKLIEKGVRFAESMGFMLGNLDFSERDDKARESLWNSLPLKTGIEVKPVTPMREGPCALSEPPPVEMAGGETPPPHPFPPPTSGKEPIEPKKESSPPPSSLKEQSGGLPKPLRTQKRPPSAGEMAARRQKLIENLGRFLASL